MAVAIRICLLGISLLLIPFTALAEGTREESKGESLFRIHCSVCHPKGGNIFNPQKSLYKKDREAHGIKSTDDIIKKMRNPAAFPTHPSEWSGMKLFDEEAISDRDALRIADYIIETFR